MASFIKPPQRTPSVKIEDLSGPTQAELRKLKDDTVAVILDAKTRGGEIILAAELKATLADGFSYEYDGLRQPRKEAVQRFCGDRPSDNMLIKDLLSLLER